VPAEHASAVEAFVSQYQRVAGQLRALIYRASCPQIIKFNSVSLLSFAPVPSTRASSTDVISPLPQILSQITDCSWDSKKMRSEVHDWVGRLADNCRAVRTVPCLTASFSSRFVHWL
jgi:hypothetical protein